jgi:hypothetical protein
VFTLLLGAAAVALSVTGTMSCTFIKLTPTDNPSWDWIIDNIGGDGNLQFWAGIFRYNPLDDTSFGASCQYYDEYFSGSIADSLIVAQICGVVAPSKYYFVASFFFV